METTDPAGELTAQGLTEGQVARCMALGADRVMRNLRLYRQVRSEPGGSRFLTPWLYRAILDDYAAQRDAPTDAEERRIERDRQAESHTVRAGDVMSQILGTGPLGPPGPPGPPGAVDLSGRPIPKLTLQDPSTTEAARAAAREMLNRRRAENQT